MDGLFILLCLCAGGWWFFKRNSQSVKFDTKYPAPVLVDAKHGVYIRPNSPAEDSIAELHRSATVHKENKNWAKAIECLRDANKLTTSVKTTYPIKHFLRLPLFLQQAGNFDAAMNEFQRLLDGTENRKALEFSHKNKTVRKMLGHADYSAIYTSMAVAAKREKLVEKAEEYKCKAEEHKAIHAKMLKADMKRSTK